MEHHLQRLDGAVGSRLVGLVDHQNVGDLQDTGLDGLDVVAHPRRFEDDGRMGGAGDVDLGLPRANRLYQNDLVAGGVEYLDHGLRGAGQPAQAAARSHRPNENPLIARQIAHAHPVAQERAAGERAGGVNGDDADTAAVAPEALGQFIDQAALAGTGRSGDADDVGLPGVGMERADDRLRGRRTTLHPGDEPRDGARVSSTRAVNPVRCNLFRKHRDLL